MGLLWFLRNANCQDTYEPLNSSGETYHTEETFLLTPPFRFESVPLHVMFRHTEET